jgi:hypothetical protein
VPLAREDHLAREPWLTGSPAPTPLDASTRVAAKAGQLRGYGAQRRLAALIACGAGFVVGLGCSDDEYCDPSYRAVCIPGGAKYDLNCVDLDDADFRVRGADPYNLDGDGDGVGCEAY